MILVDANILLYAEDSKSPRHAAAREWWDIQLSGASPVCLNWSVLSAFLRIATNHRVYEHPLSLDDAIGRIDSWLRQPCVRIVHPTDQHWRIFVTMLTSAKAVANLVADAHLAALTVEHGCELCSTDNDFARFPNLAWTNPLEDRRSSRRRHPSS